MRGRAESARWSYWLSLAVIGAVLGFWITGIFFLPHVLKNETSPLTIVLWLYITLAAVAGSLMVFAAAATHIIRRIHDAPRPAADQRVESRS